MGVDAGRRTERREGSEGFLKKIIPKKGGRGAWAKKRQPGKLPAVRMLGLYNTSRCWCMSSSTSFNRLRIQAKIPGVMPNRKASSQRRALGPAFAGRADSGRTSSGAPSVWGPVCAPNETSGTGSGGDDGQFLTRLCFIKPPDPMNSLCSLTGK